MDRTMRNRYTLRGIEYSFNYRTCVRIRFMGWIGPYRPNGSTFQL